MIDRAGEIWEFDDGMIMVVVATHPREGQGEIGPVSHDVLILREADHHPPDDFHAGAFSDEWHESENKLWDDRQRSGRWRIV